MFKVYRVDDVSDAPKQHPYSDRIEQLLQRAAELGNEARDAETDEQRRTNEALASMCEGSARCFAHLQAFRTVLDDLQSAQRRRDQPME